MIGQDSFEDAVVYEAYYIQKKSGIAVPGNVIHRIFNMFNYIKIQDWTLPNVIRECADRKASKEEDVVYGILGLLNIDNIEVKYNIGTKSALLKLARAIPTDKMALLIICEWNRNVIPQLSNAAWGLDVDECVADANISEKNSMHITAGCIDILSAKIFTSNTIQAGKTGTARSSLQEITLETHDEKGVTCFGRIPSSVNACTLILIGTTRKSWATEALNAVNVGICVVVTKEEEHIQKEGLVVVGMDNIKFKPDSFNFEI